VAGTTELWTLDQLTELVGTALAVDYPGQVNGRVRAVPDRRAIRWYSTIGLVDRPAEMRGRTALYGRRHLLQLVAIKRLQSRGRTLAEIQAELSGATDRTLRSIAALPTVPSVAAGSPAPRPMPEPAPQPVREQARGRFWADRPAAAADADQAALVTAIRLADGVTVVLDATGVTPIQLTPEQLSALHSAAVPLLAELARQRLTHHPDGHSPRNHTSTDDGNPGRSTAQQEPGDPT